MSEGSRLSRWSQRKLAAKKHGGALPEPADIATETVSPGDAALPVDGDRNELSAPNQALKPKVAGGAPEQAETMLTEADLPSIDGLTAQSDYTVFLKNNVPEALRKAALRKLWVSDPVLANLDGLNDYDDDYTIVTAMTMDDTSYKIGRGMLGDEPKPELEPGAEPANTGEALTARADRDDSQNGSELVGEEEADASSEEGSEHGYSDAPAAASSDETRLADVSELDDADESGAAIPKSPADPAS